MVRTIALLLLLLSGTLATQETPYSSTQPGYHAATIELARLCFSNNLISQGKELRDEALKGAPAGSDEKAAAEKLAQEFDLAKPDIYTAKAWGDYLDKREALQRKRAEAAWQALGRSGIDFVQNLDWDHKAAREAYGYQWLDGVGWLKPAEATRLKPCVQALKDAPAKNERVANWENPYVLVGEHFSVVTDLPWWRALRYTRLLDRFYNTFFELFGDVIPKRSGINLIWLCAKAADFIKVSTQFEFPMTEKHEGAYLRWHGFSVINAERADEVGRLNKARDNLARTLYHEGVHRIVEAGCCGKLPMSQAWGNYAEPHGWIVEAIAIVFENLEIKDKGFSLNSLEAQRTFSLGKMKKAEAHPQLAPIFAQSTSDFGTSAPIHVADKYAVAGSVAWYCLFVKKDAYRLAFLVLLIDQYRGDTKARGFEARFGVKLEDFEKAWKTYAFGK
ncbi:MAG: hypothetical protein KBG84_13685 [Planctomycetes bacterium]|nr:hypothetical protein [Planctomycetota bacterium]